MFLKEKWWYCDLLLHLAFIWYVVDVKFFTVEHNCRSGIHCGEVACQTCVVHPKLRLIICVYSSVKQFNDIWFEQRRRRNWESIAEQIQVGSCFLVTEQVTVVPPHPWIRGMCELNFWWMQRTSQGIFWMQKWCWHDCCPEWVAFTAKITAFRWPQQWTR